MDVFPDLTRERKFHLKYSKCRLFLLNDTNDSISKTGTGTERFSSRGN